MVILIAHGSECCQSTIPFPGIGLGDHRRYGRHSPAHGQRVAVRPTKAAGVLHLIDHAVLGAHRRDVGGCYDVSLNTIEEITDEGGLMILRSVAAAVVRSA